MTELPELEALRGVDDHVVVGPPPTVDEIARCARSHSWRQAIWGSAAVAAIVSVVSGFGVIMPSNDRSPVTDRHSAIAGQPDGPTGISCSSERRVVMPLDEAPVHNGWETLQGAVDQALRDRGADGILVGQPSDDATDANLLLLREDGTAYEDLHLMNEHGRGWFVADSFQCPGGPTSTGGD